MYTKIISSKRKISDIQAYLIRDKINPDATRNVRESTFLCGKNWAEEMTANAAIWGKENDGVNYHQIIIASDPSQVPPPKVQDVHFAGKRVAELFSRKGFPVAVETHADTEQIHDHIIVGAVNVFDGHKLQISKAKSAEKAKKADFRFVEITSAVDEICKKYNLMTLTESKERKTQQQKDNKEQPTNQLNIYIKDSYQRAVQDKLIDVWKNPNVFTHEDFRKVLEKHGIKISRITKKGGITYQDLNGHKVRAKKIGAFELSDINDLIELNETLLKKRQEEQDREEAKRKEKQIATAKEEADTQQRIAIVQQYSAEQADEEKKKEKQKEVDKKRLDAEKEKLINAVNEIMNSGFISLAEWKEERKKRHICISADNENNIIYRFDSGTVEISSKDYPAYSRDAVVKTAGTKKLKEKEEREKGKTAPKIEPKVRKVEHERSRGKGVRR